MVCSLILWFVLECQFKKARYIYNIILVRPSCLSFIVSCNMPSEDWTVVFVRVSTVDKRTSPVDINSWPKHKKNKR